MSTVNIFFYYLPSILFDLSIAILLSGVWWKYRNEYKVTKIPFLLITIGTVIKSTYSIIETLAGVLDGGLSGNKSINITAVSCVEGHHQTKVVMEGR